MNAVDIYTQLLFMREIFVGGGENNAEKIAQKTERKESCETG